MQSKLNGLRGLSVSMIGTDGIFHPVSLNHHEISYFKLKIYYTKKNT